MVRRRSENPLLPALVSHDPFDTELLGELERHTVELRTEEGTEYLVGIRGGVLWVPRDE